jgi:hypothetical protein
MLEYQSKEWLYEQYWNKGLSTPKIAKIYKIAQRTLYNWMNKFNIKRRTFSDYKGKTSYQWKGGIRKRDDGYILKWIPTNSLYAPMKADKKYILQHRYVMAKHLGRLLDDNEIVHHIDGNKKNNKIQNLKLMTRGEHIKLHKNY